MPFEISKINLERLHPQTRSAAHCLGASMRKECVEAEALLKEVEAFPFIHEQREFIQELLRELKFTVKKCRDRKRNTQAVRLKVLRECMGKSK